MKQLRLILAAFVLVAGSQAASAFEQTQVGVGSAGTAAAPSASMAAPATTATPPGNLPGVSLVVPKPGKAESGIEVRLPMIGVIGRLPKLDFGLELLYGADKDSMPEEDRLSPPSNDLTIRGSVKRRF